MSILETLPMSKRERVARAEELLTPFDLMKVSRQMAYTLSGGERRRVAIAGVLAMEPDVLILDEPTSQLDPIAASDFLATLGKINRELGTTIILTEHRLEEAFPLASTVVVMDKGKLLCTGTPKEVGVLLKDKGHAMFLAMPSAMRVWAAVENTADCPIPVRARTETVTAWQGRWDIRSPR